MKEELRVDRVLKSEINSFNGAANRYKVPKKQWNRWPALARKVFNEVFSSMRDQSLYQHPRTVKSPTVCWKTTRWNAAWTAADAVRDNSK